MASFYSTGSPPASIDSLVQTPLVQTPWGAVTAANGGFVGESPSFTVRDHCRPCGLDPGPDHLFICRLDNECLRASRLTRFLPPRAPHPRPPHSPRFDLDRLSSWNHFPRRDSPLPHRIAPSYSLRHCSGVDLDALHIVARCLYIFYSRIDRRFQRIGMSVEIDREHATRRARCAISAPGLK